MPLPELETHVPLGGVYVVTQHDCGAQIIAAFTDETEADRLAEAMSDPGDMPLVSAEVTFEPIYKTAQECIDDLELDVELGEDETDA